MNGVVADTHAVLWYLAGDIRLSPNALEAFERARLESGQIFLPSVPRA